MSEDVKKLPKWAQQKIELLEQNLDYQTKQLLQFGPNAGGKSNVWLEMHPTTDAPPFYLPDRTEITFRFENDARISVRLKAGALSIYCPTGALQVHPEMSNVITVSGEKD